MKAELLALAGAMPEREKDNEPRGDDDGRFSCLWNGDIRKHGKILAGALEKKNSALLT
jgi:hypothetical protein